MDVLLAQGLNLTILGMGMTFLSLGALVLGMYLMTALIKDAPPEAEEDEAEFVAAPEVAAPDAARYLAAAAAVAVALEQSAQVWTPATASAMPPARVWNTQVRSRQLIQQQQHVLRRSR